VSPPTRPGSGSPRPPATSSWTWTHAPKS
jgi:hypothetical protein